MSIPVFSEFSLQKNVTFFRNIVALVFAAFILYRRHIPLKQEKGNALALFLLLAGLAASGGQFSITAAYTHAPAKDISIFDYMQIIFSSLLGLIVLHEVPVWLSVVGYFIIIGSSLAMFLIRRRKEA